MFFATEDSGGDSDDDGEQEEILQRNIKAEMSKQKCQR